MGTFKKYIYGSLFVNNNITGNTLTLSSITNDNSLTQILSRDSSDGSVKYRDVASIISAATSQDTFVTGFTFNNSTYDLTIKQNEGQPDLVSNLSVLASDVYVLSGIYDPSTGIVTYTNSSGGTFQVSGFTTGMTDSYTTDAYINGTEIRFDNNIQGTNFYSVDLNPLLSGFTGTFTGNTSATCISDLWVTNISGCSPVTIGTEVEFNRDVDLNTSKLVFNSAPSDSFIRWNDTITDAIEMNNVSGDGVWIGDVAQQLGTEFDTNQVRIHGASLMGSLKFTNALSASSVSIFGNNVSQGSTIQLESPDNSGTIALTSDFYNVTGFTYSNNNFTIGRDSGESDLVATINTMTGLTVNGSVSATTFYGDGSNLTGIGGTFTGNTSASCITDLWVTNISGCSPVTIGTELIVNDDTNINGHLTVTSSGTNTSDIVFLVEDSVGNHIIDCSDTGKVHIGDYVNSASPTSPTLLIGAGKTPNDRGSLAFTSTGIGIGGDNDAIGDFLLFRLQNTGDSRWLFKNASAFGFAMVDRQSNSFGSQSGVRSSFYTNRGYGMDFLLDYDEYGVADTCGFRFSSKSGTTAGASATNIERFVIENGSLNTKSYFDNISVLGVGTSTPDTNVKLHVSGDALINGGLTANTINLVNTPTLNNSGTEILVRNSSTGDVEYRDVTSITADTNTTITGFTYDDANTFTISDSDGSNYSASINTMTGLTVNGTLSATTYYGDGSNLTGISGGGTFTGNTSATCITDLWVTNISGCSPVTIGTEAIFNQDVSGNTSYWFGQNNAGGGSKSSLTPMMTLFDNPSSGNYAGPTLEFSDNGNKGQIFYRRSTGGNSQSNAFNFMSDGGFNFEGSGDLGSGVFFSIAKGQSTFTIDDNTLAPRTDIKIHNGNGGSPAYSRLGLGNANDYWYFEADDITQPMHIGWDDGVTEKNVFIFTTSAGTIDTNITITSGFTLSQTPTLNNSGTDILIRNSSTGDVEYRDITSITADTNTTITGFTYNDANTFTISDSDGSNYSASINTMTGLTINGESTGTTLTVNQYLEFKVHLVNYLV